jgi:hypothetical protein
MRITVSKNGEQIAALFVDVRGIYASDNTRFNAWDIERDARLYDGDDVVIAHPPCNRWCRLADLVQARWGYKVGDDGGCFASALASVRRCTGVLEHPAYSKAWAAFGLPVPHRTGGWIRGLCGGWSCHVEQGRYGHVAKKATWLYAYGPEGWTPPAMRWGYTPDSKATHPVSWCGNKTKGTKRPRVGKRAASATPPEFLEALVAIALSARHFASSNE